MQPSLNRTAVLDEHLNPVKTAKLFNHSIYSFLIDQYFRLSSAIVAQLSQHFLYILSSITMNAPNP